MGRVQHGYITPALSGSPKERAGGGGGRKNSLYMQTIFFRGYPRRGGLYEKIRAKIFFGSQDLKVPQLYPTSLGLERATRIFFKVTIDVSTDMGGICV